MAISADIAVREDRALVAGVPIAYREGGTGDVVLLLHGIGSSAESWRAPFDILIRRWRLIAWDAPGYGGSGEAAQDHPTPADYADLAAGLLDALGIERCHLIGHSLGGLIGASMARRHGERLRSLLLTAPAGGYGAAPGQPWPKPVQSRLDDLARLGPAGMAAGRAARLCAPGARPEVIAEVERIMAATRPRGYAQACALLGQGDIMADAPRIAVRTRVLVGADDAVTPVEKCRAIASRIPGAGFAVLSAVGHACYLEDPVGFADAVADFIGATP